MLKTVLLSMVIAFGASATLAQTPPVLIDGLDNTDLHAYLLSKELSELSIEELRQLALITFLEGNEVGEVTTKRLVKYGRLLDTFVKQSNNDPEIVAIRKGYNGVRAREALLGGWISYFYSKSATSGLDELVKNNPDNGGVIMQRGLNAVFTPSFMGRNRFIEKDFNELLSERFALQGAARSYVLYYLAVGYKKMGENDAAQAQLDEIIQIDAAPWVELAHEMMIDLQG